MPFLRAQQFSSFLHRRTVRRVATGAAAAVLLYGTVGFFILPGIVRSQVEKLCEDKLGRKASVAAVEVNPFTLELTLRGFRLQEKAGEATFASFDLLHLNLSSASLLRLAPVVREARLSGPTAHLVRSGAHRYNFDDILDSLARQPQSDEPARFSVNNIQVDRGRIVFDDRPAGTVHEVNDLALGIPFVSSLPAQVNIFVEPLLSAQVDGSPLHFKGRARPFAEPADAVLELKLDGLDLTRFVGYLPFRPRAKVAGARLDLDLTASFREEHGKAPALVLGGTAALKSVLVNAQDGKPLLRAKEFALQLKEADVFAGRVHVTKATLDGLQADVERDADGALNLNGLLATADAPPKAAAPHAAPAPFNLTLDEFALRNAALRYSDPRSVRATVDKLDAGLRRLTLDSRKRSIAIGEIASGRAAVVVEPAAASAAAAKSVQAAPANGKEGEKGYTVNVARAGIDNWSVRLQERRDGEAPAATDMRLGLALQELSNAPGSRARLRLDASVGKAGRLAAEGTLGAAPLHADLALDIKGIDLLPLQPYVADRINLRVTHAELSADGRLRLDSARDGALAGGFKGNAALGNVATLDRTGGNDFLRWKSLHANGMDMRLAPFALSVDELALSDFFARIIIDPSGRINLQDVVRGDPNDKRTAEKNTSEKAAMPPLAIRKLTLQGGRVRFTDNFIRPNYSASLTAFGGALSGLSSAPDSSAAVDLRGEVNGAPLSVGGRINPLRGDLFLDLKAAVRGMELAPLSAYSGKYVGYGIEKGKLSFDVAYQLDHRKLSANNRLVLEQLTFGDKVDSPKATSLPVHFAVALLSDRNGVIDINLPIAGSLDDPQFSVGEIIVKLIGNALVKAVTQPFATLGALFGHGAELSSMNFEAGRATVPPAGEEKLRALAKALTERPALKLDITGHASAEADREGLKHAQLERRLRGLKLRDLQARGVSVEPGSVTVSREEYPALLTRAYRDADFAKPRNLIGLPKNLPVEEMEKLMLANDDIDEDDLRALGNQRAQAVKTWLQRNGQVAPERIFIVAAKIGAAKEGGPAPSRVDFALR